MNYTPGWDSTTVPVVVGFELIVDLVEDESLSLNGQEIIAITHNDLGAYTLRFVDGSTEQVQGTVRLDCNTESRPTRSRQ